MSRLTTKQRRAARRRKDWVGNRSVVSARFTFYGWLRCVPTVYISKADLAAEYPE